VADRTLTISWEDPTEPAARAHGSGGLDFLRAIVAGELPPAPIQELLGFQLIEADEGRVVFRGEPGEQHLRGLSPPYGRFAAYPPITGSAMGAAVHSTLEQGRAYATLEVKYNLVRPITADTGPVLAEGKVVHRGGTVATVEGHLRAEEGGALLAHGTSTCLIR
jgi:uncharacterized protein (TIGR00369 family)